VADPTDIYRQCKYTRATEDGYKFDVAWIPEKFAVRGKVIRFKDSQELWTIAEVWGKRTYAWLLANEREYKALKSIQGRGAIDDSS